MITTEIPTCIMSIKIVTHISAAETFTCIMLQNFHLHNCNKNSHLHNCNKKIHQYKCSRKYHQHNCYRTLNCIIAADVSTCIIAIESVSCIVPTETATCRIDYRNFHLQKWCQSEILLVIIKKFSE